MTSVPQNIYHQQDRCLTSVLFLNNIIDMNIHKNLHGQTFFLKT